MRKAPVENRELGVTILPAGGAGILFWSPSASSAGAEVAGKGYFPLEKRDYGYWEGKLPGVNAGDRYMIVIDNEKKIPDPVSLSQPDGVHAASEVVDAGPFSPAANEWSGISPASLIIYELHTGTFSPEGNFEGVIKKLDYLAGMGINAVELMPVAQFPGTRNWGYDGVFPFAVQNSYGGPARFARLVDECHRRGIAVILDVVYNHLGPEGNYLAAAGPYFTDKYRTPWGSAINFDDAWSDGVRRYFTENALMWMRDFGVDGLRLDAVHAIKDTGAVHFLAELSGYVERLNRLTGKNHFLIGESDLNDARYITPSSEGGIGLDSQWCDEFHHALHARLTGERTGFYADFGDTSHLVDSLNNAFVYNGKYSAHRKRIFGNSTTGIPGSRFVVFTQNHDQVGNRMSGERLSSLAGFESLKLAAGAIFFSPFVPMLFMGEEYGEDNPFLYFTSHSDRNLIEAVRKGRKKEFSDFMSHGVPSDPQSEQTFESSKLSWDHTGNEKREKLLDFYRQLIHMKKTIPALKPGSRQNVAAAGAAGGKAIILEIGTAAGSRQGAGSNTGSGYPDNGGEKGMLHVPGAECNDLTVIMNLSEKPVYLPFAGMPAGGCNILLYSAHKRWGGPVNDFASLTAEDGRVIIAPSSILVLSGEQLD